MPARNSMDGQLKHPEVRASMRVASCFTNQRSAMNKIQQLCRAGSSIPLPRWGRNVGSDLATGTCQFDRRGGYRISRATRNGDWGCGVVAVQTDFILSIGSTIGTVVLCARHRTAPLSRIKTSRW